MTEEKYASAAADTVGEFVFTALRAAGCAELPSRSVAEALTEASLRGVDSHGIRLLVHYARVVRGGRINPTPKLGFSRSGPVTGVVDGDNGFGHYASFSAMDHGIEMARESGIAALSVINSSHFGAAGCYVLRATREGLMALCTCNSDSFVLPHDGRRPFHGTNPIAFAAPVSGSRPYLVDMATSVIPWNRVQDLRMKKLLMPPDVAVNSDGEPTRDPEESAALLPLGGTQFGYKGAALASIAEVLSAIVTGMPHCSRLLGMAGPDIETPRHLGHFFVIIDPTRFVSREVYEAGMRAYLEDLRSQPAKSDRKVMAPGDREWAVEAQRAERGIPITESLLREFDRLADELQISPLQRGNAS